MADADEAIIDGVLAGDVDRYAELVTKYQGQALRLAFGLLGHYEDARDASQEAFVGAYRGLRRFRRGAKFSTWLYRIVVNACYDASRRRARRPLPVAASGAADEDDVESGLFMVDVSDASAGPDEQLANRELSQRLSQAIDMLPMKQRAAFTLHHLQGLSLEQSAQIMGCRLGTVKSHVFRATQQLRRQLQPWLSEEGFAWTS